MSVLCEGWVFGAKNVVNFVVVCFLMTYGTCLAAGLVTLL